MSSEARLDELYQALSSAGPSRRDGYGMGMGMGPAAQAKASKLTSEPVLSADDVERLIAHHWRARREITQPKGDLIREGVEIEGLPTWVDPDAVQSWLQGDVVDASKSRRVDQPLAPLAALGELWAEGESYGGAVMIPVGEDGREPWEPLDLDRLQEVIAWEVLSRHEIWPHRLGRRSGPVDHWLITGEASSLTSDLLTSSNQIVHPSRVIVHPGMWMPRRWRVAHDGWGLSRLELLITERLNAEGGAATLRNMLRKNSQDVVILADLHEMQEEFGDTYVRRRAEKMNAALSADNWLVLDGGFPGDDADAPREPDKFETMARPLSGGADTAEALHSDWAHGASFPKVVADGEVSGGGLNTGAEAGPWRAWAGTIQAEQVSVLTAYLNRQLLLGFASKLGPTGGRIPKTWSVKWNSIAELDPLIEARVGLLEAQADEIYSPSRIGTLTEQELKQWRNVEGKRGTVRTDTADVLPTPEPPALPSTPNKTVDGGGE